ncbi:chemotaxis protein CheA [Noviherbaspirillum denitrificans]|uniref:Chemotaxis protein CheA n=1 Tax=Noviherbaspirillum denitrificans TaxID=1968433 RepID=A0A254TQ98_9BURK|nr:chemotaxis protein CheA [Noviherbaspirillum denitrificans]OWW21908.1 chemotaxis protein CheA [Noviherbaspirillum denitrificans]
MNLDQALQTFIAESKELLEDMENALLAIEQTEDRSENVNAIFRAAHTIKGSSGLFGLDHIVSFTHVVENVLDHVRGGKLDINDQLVSLLLACGDHIGTLVDTVAAGQMEADDKNTERGLPLLDKLRTYLAPVQQAPAAAPALVAQEPPEVERLDGDTVASDHWHISLRFGRDVLKNGMDPLSFIRYLGTLGTIVGIATLPDGIPEAADMDPECCYLGYEIAFRSDADKTTIENVFDFVREDCRLRILPPKSRLSDYVRLLREIPTETTRIGELLMRCGTITANELDAALNTQTDADTSQPLGQILIEQRAVQPEVVEAALTKQKQMRETHAQESKSIRVDADKLDQLINLVGELIIAGASANLIARRAHASELQESMSKVTSLVESVRDSALQLRMVKIGATFNRFQRVVHDVAREIGKDIALEVDGVDTELDKTVVEKIGDPLTHLVRNAMDHGIEPAEVRMARGKPARGTVRLDACHDSGSIVISVSDDGGGLKREKILAKAIERGLVEPGHHLADEDVYKLIFEPGFSTADQISNLSGRGVGLDVVKRNITALRGTVGVQTAEGVGTTVTIRLPLTLAIIDGFLVEVGKSVFAIPLDMIEECVAYSAEPGHDYTNLRGQVLPFIRLRDLFDVEGAPSKRENIVVLKHAGRKAGLVVDTLLGEFQTVIKPLGKMFGGIKCISGSTILGSGEVALILDVPALVQQSSINSQPGNAGNTLAIA